MKGNKNPPGVGVEGKWKGNKNPFGLPDLENGREMKWWKKKGRSRSGTEDAEIRASSVPSLYKSGWSEASPKRGLWRVAGRPEA